MGKPAPACLCQHPAHLAPPNALASPTPGYPRGAVLPLPSLSSTQPQRRLPPGFPLIHLLTGGLSWHPGVGREHSHLLGFAPLGRGAVGVLPTALAFGGPCRHTPHSQQLVRSPRNVFPWHGPQGAESGDCPGEWAPPRPSLALPASRPGLRGLGVPGQRLVRFPTPVCNKHVSLWGL